VFVLQHTVQSVQTSRLAKSAVDAALSRGSLEQNDADLVALTKGPDCQTVCNALQCVNASFQAAKTSVALESGLTFSPVNASFAPAIKKYTITVLFAKVTRSRAAAARCTVTRYFDVADSPISA
jgi:hypothetical protein